MKILVNYDLMDKLNEYERGYDLKKNFKIILFSEIGAATFGYASTFKGDLKKCIFDMMFYTVLSTTVLTPIWCLVDKVFGIEKIIAKDSLINLSKDLKSLNINTNLELLKDSEVVKTNYKFKLNENKLPVLKEDKYIRIKTLHPYGKEQEEYLHQEHIIGRREYEISNEEPPKKKVRKLALGGI